MARRLQISDSEWDVMEPILAAGVCRAADVIKQLPCRLTTGTTARSVQLLGARLVEKKGVSVHDVDGVEVHLSCCRFSPAMRAARKAARSWRKAFGGDVYRC